MGAHDLADEHTGEVVGLDRAGAGVLVEERAQILGADRRIVVFHGEFNATSHGGDRDPDRLPLVTGMHAAQAAESVALERRHAIGDARFTLRS